MATYIIVPLWVTVLLPMAIILLDFQLSNPLIRLGYAFAPVLVQTVVRRAVFRLRNRNNYDLLSPLSLWFVYIAQVMCSLLLFPRLVMAPFALCGFGVEVCSLVGCTTGVSALFIPRLVAAPFAIYGFGVEIRTLAGCIAAIAAGFLTRGFAWHTNWGNVIRGFEVIQSIENFVVTMVRRVFWNIVHVPGWIYAQIPAIATINLGLSVASFLIFTVLPTMCGAQVPWLEALFAHFGLGPLNFGSSAGQDAKFYPVTMLEATVWAVYQLVSKMNDDTTVVSVESFKIICCCVVCCQIGLTVVNLWQHGTSFGLRMASRDGKPRIYDIGDPNQERSREWLMLVGQVVGVMGLSECCHGAIILPFLLSLMLNLLTFWPWCTAFWGLPEVERGARLWRRQVEELNALSVQVGDAARLIETGRQEEENNARKRRKEYARWQLQQVEKWAAENKVPPMLAGQLFAAWYVRTRGIMFLDVLRRGDAPPEPIPEWVDYGIVAEIG